MFYDETQALKACEEDPSLIFQLMKEGHFQLVDQFLKMKVVPLSITDEQENTILMQLLRYKKYEMVLKYMNRKEIDINHQNSDGNTFAHLLLNQNDLAITKIIQGLEKRKDFLPNIKNKEGKTILDLSIEKEYFWTTLHILKDKRFDNIDVISFQHLYETYIKNDAYGKYSKVTNLEQMINYLKKKDSLLPRVHYIIEQIYEEMKNIQEEILKNRSTIVDTIIASAYQEGV